MRTNTVILLFFIAAGVIPCISSHPWDLLSGDEIDAAGTLVRAEFSGTDIFIMTITPLEPEKTVLRKYLDTQTKNGGKWKEKDIFPRKALAVVLNRETGRTFEIVVDLNQNTIESKKELAKGVQPMLTPAEFELVDRILRTDPGIQSRLKKQGVNIDWIFFDIWVPGTECAGYPEFCGKRLAVAFLYFRENEEDNAYAHPLNLYPIVDLLAEEVLRIDYLPINPDYTRPPNNHLDLPHTSANYDPRLLPPESFRDDIKPLTTTSEGGPSFKITDNYQIDWQGFRLRVGFNTREGVTLHDVSFQEFGKNKPRRSILYRAAFSEMVVPYSDPRKPFYPKGAFDIGEYGLAMAANSLTAGIDCMPQGHLIHVYNSDQQGSAVQIPNAICISEVDGGLLHRHTNGDRVTVSRAQNLEITFKITSTNYDYSFIYRFHQDGVIDFEVGLSGLLSTNLLMFGRLPWASIVAEKVMAQYHQHFFCVRLDTKIDGESNSVSTVDMVPMEDNPITNPFGNGFVAKETLLTTSLNSVTDANMATNRVWKIFNPNSINPSTGNKRGYKLVTNNRPLSFANDRSLVAKRAGFCKHSTWVIPYKDGELYAGGDYPNQNEETDGVAKWVKRNESIINTDNVLFHVFGFTHNPISEDYPLMGMETTSISLRPANFFDRYVGLTIPPPPGFLEAELKNSHHGELKNISPLLAAST